MRRKEGRGAHLLPLPLSVSCRGAAAAASAACLPFRRRRSEIPRGHASSRLGPPPPPLPAGWLVALSLRKEALIAQEVFLVGQRAEGRGREGTGRRRQRRRLATVLSADDANCDCDVSPPSKSAKCTLAIGCSKLNLASARRSKLCPERCLVLKTDTSVH